ncbi:MAG: hypothetical protein PVH25_13230 [Burkholderiales bacterium]|jgi:hypothetical protein
MKIVKTTIAAVMFGMSVSAFAAVSDISSVTHGSKAGQKPQVGQIAQPRWSDINSVTEKGASNEVKPFTKAAGNYSFGDISNVTHN